MSATAAIAAPAPAQEKATAAPLTPAAAINIRLLADPEFSPDGARLAFVVSEPPKGSGRQRHIWILEAKSGAVRQFTFSGKSESTPRWSPDGQLLAFLSNRDERQQVYLLRVDGGESWAFTSGKRGVSDFAWSPDGKQIAFLAPNAPTDAEEKKEKDKDDARVVDKDDRHSRLWVQAIGSPDAKALTPASSEVSALVWSAPGDRLVISMTDTPQSDQETNRIFSVRVSDGHLEQLAAPRGPFGGLRLSPKGTALGFVGARDGGPVPHDLFVATLSASTAPRDVTGVSLDRPISDFRFAEESAGVAVAEDGFRNLFTWFTADGARRDPATFTTNPHDFAVAPSGAIAFVGQSATAPPEIWFWDRKSPPRQLSHLNDAWNQFTLSAPEYFRYKSFDGKEIDAALVKPAGYDGKTKLPLITLVHGGPTGRWTASIDPWGQLLAARGYAVFYANIRGSSGYGESFLESNRADWGGADYKDLMAGVDALVARGIADPTRLGIGGWSYGGYMAEWAITQTTRFKAAVSGAGMANLISEFGTEAGSSYDEWFYGVPYETADRFLKSSPFVYLKNAKTPTLILQGDADPVDPLGQSQELYRGLKHYGVEAELVVYPRELHGFQEELHLIDRLNRILAWYDKFLK